MMTLKSNVIRGALTLALCAIASAQTQVVRFRSVPNDGTTGTTLGLLAKVNSSGNAVIATTSDTGVPVYCVTAGAGLTGNASLASGQGTCQTDGSGATVNHYLGASTATGGRLKDLGTTIPSGVWIAGIATATAGANANVSFIVLGFLGGSSSGGSLSNPSIGTTAITETFTVGTGGVSANTLVIEDTSNPSKAIAATGSGAYGVAMSTVSASGSVEVARYGKVACYTDNAVTAGDLAIAGTSNVTYCKDSGQTASSGIPMGTRIIGVFQTSASSGSTAVVELTPAHFGTEITQGQIAGLWIGSGCSTTTNSLLVDGNCGTGSGSGATAINQLTDGLYLRTSNTVITGSWASGGTNVGAGNFGTADSGTWTITISTGAASATQFYTYVNSASGAILVDTNGANFTGVTCSGCTLTNTGVSGPPTDPKYIPLTTTTAGSTANQWDSFTSCLPTNTSGCIDTRVFLKASPYTANEPGLIRSGPTNGSYDFSADRTLLAQKFFISSGTPGSMSGNLPGDLVYLTASPYTVWSCDAPAGTSAPACTSVTAGGWTAFGGGSSTAKVPIWEGSFFQTTISGGGGSNSSVWQIGGAGGGPYCSNASGGNPPEICQLGLTNASGQNISYVFVWDTSITAIDFHFVFGASSSSGGNFRFLASLGCQTLGTTFQSGTWTYGSVSTGATISALAANDTIAVAFTAIAIPTCAAGSMMSLNLTRDQTVGSNDADDARLYNGSIISTRTLP